MSFLAVNFTMRPKHPDCNGFCWCTATNQGFLHQQRALTVRRSAHGAI